VVFGVLANLLRRRYARLVYARNITDESYALLNVSNGQRLQIPRDADRYFGVSLRARIR
jgi:iron complex outermembrane receptor protein